MSKVYTLRDFFVDIGERGFIHQLDDIDSRERHRLPQRIRTLLTAMELKYPCSTDLLVGLFSDRPALSVVTEHMPEFVRRYLSQFSSEITNFTNFNYAACDKADRNIWRDKLGQTVEKFMRAVDKYSGELFNEDVFGAPLEPSLYAYLFGDGRMRVNVSDDADSASAHVITDVPTLNRSIQNIGYIYDSDVGNVEKSSRAAVAQDVSVENSDSVEKALDQIATSTGVSGIGFLLNILNETPEYADKIDIKELYPNGSAEAKSNRRALTEFGKELTDYVGRFGAEYITGDKKPVVSQFYTKLIERVGKLVDIDPSVLIAAYGMLRDGRIVVDDNFITIKDPAQMKKSVHEVPADVILDETETLDGLYSKLGEGLTAGQFSDAISGIVTFGGKGVVIKPGERQVLIKKVNEYKKTVDKVNSVFDNNSPSISRSDLPVAEYHDDMDVHPSQSLSGRGQKIYKNLVNLVEGAKSDALDRIEADVGKDGYRKYERMFFEKVDEGAAHDEYSTFERNAKMTLKQRIGRKLEKKVLDDVATAEKYVMGMIKTDRENAAEAAKKTEPAAPEPVPASVGTSVESVVYSAQTQRIIELFKADEIFALEERYGIETVNKDSFSAYVELCEKMADDGVREYFDSLGLDDNPEHEKIAEIIKKAYETSYDPEKVPAPTSAVDPAPVPAEPETATPVPKRGRGRARGTVTTETVYDTYFKKWMDDAATKYERSPDYINLGELVPIQQMVYRRTPAGRAAVQKQKKLVRLDEYRRLHQESFDEDLAMRFSNEERTNVIAEREAKRAYYEEKGYSREHADTLAMKTLIWSDPENFREYYVPLGRKALDAPGKMVN
ncbi:MAG: hypothetical protein ABIA21_04230, partial [Candidatus Aenigmatarchaeota archaeon]